MTSQIVRLKDFENKNRCEGIGWYRAPYLMKRLFRQECLFYSLKGPRDNKASVLEQFHRQVNRLVVFQTLEA